MFTVIGGLSLLAHYYINGIKSHTWATASMEPPLCNQAGSQVTDNHILFQPKPVAKGKNLPAEPGIILAAAKKKRIRHWWTPTLHV
jgi:hypothetical protein